MCVCVGEWGNGISLLCDPRPSHTVVLDLTLSCHPSWSKTGPRVQKKLPPAAAMFTQWAFPPSFYPIKVTRQAALGESEDSPRSLGQSLPYCGC